MKKFFLLSLLLYNYTIISMESANQSKINPYKALDLIFNTKAHLDKNIIVIIGSSLEESKIKDFVKSAFSASKESAPAFMLFAEKNKRLWSHKIQRYDTENKTFNDQKKFLEIDLFKPEQTCKLVVMCINKNTMSFDGQTPLARVDHLISIAKKEENKAVRFCFLVDQEGLDTQVFPVLQLLCEKLKPREHSITAQTIAQHPLCEFMFMNQEMFENENKQENKMHYTATVNKSYTCAEYYLITMKNSCMPLKMVLYTAMTSKTAIFCFLASVSVGAVSGWLIGRYTNWYPSFLPIHRLI